MSIYIPTYPYTSILISMHAYISIPRCGFSQQMISLLHEQEVKDYSTFDILEDREVREGLKTYSNWPTFPQLYLKGELIGMQIYIDIDDIYVMYVYDI